MNEVPEISVVMPVFNAARYLEAAIKSILAQTFTNFELITVDDGSNDSSLTILRRYARCDRRIRLITRPNTGIVGALNDGIAASSAPFIARMDADDLAVAERFELQIAYMRSHPNCVGLGTAVDFIDSRDARVMACPRPIAHEDIEAGLLKGDGGTIIHPSVMFLRDAVVTVGGYRPEAQYVEDLDIYLRLAEVGRLANLPEKLLFYRVHPKSINFTKNANRHRTKLAVMAEACRARGLAFRALDYPERHGIWGDPVRRYREWAISALQFGTRRVAIRHGVAACRLEPLNLQSWQSLSYALTAPLPHSAESSALSS
jgi:glycosyltransferase involved in cell wall biosynthesis